MPQRLILAYLARVADASATELATALGYSEAEVSAQLQVIAPALAVDANSNGRFSITDTGRASLLNASTPADVSAALPASIDSVFAETSVNPDATFLADVRNAGFTSLDARDLRYLVAEYGIGASIESGDIAILTRCAQLSRLAGLLAARL